ncbi:Uncharacterised protein [[Clostridium] sordellii]|nr:Uncharacterised protein [[Clostridium] sordellii] [Paeniclostridium sordellii]
MIYMIGNLIKILDLILKSGVYYKYKYTDWRD